MNTKRCPTCNDTLNYKGMSKVSKEYVCDGCKRGWHEWISM